MTRSANEIEVMVLKACRGAGIPLAQGQEVGRVAARFSGCIPAILDHLNRRQPQLNLTLTNGVRFDGCHALRDGPNAIAAILGGADRATLSGLMADAFITHLAEQSGVLIVEGDEGVVFKPGGAALPPQQRRAEIPDDQWQALNTFAALTYVPETETSRLGGAGAGLTDND